MAPRSLTRRGWIRPRATVLGMSAAALVATTVPALPAQSVDEASCPVATPARAIDKGMRVHGLTVSSGTTPDAFQGEVLGVLQDGIAPGLDMIMVRLEGSEITHDDGSVDKGIWAGMSGSPVYDNKGRLLGAVAYGLSWSPSDVAGVTPGAAMRELLDSQDSTAIQTAASTKKIAIPDATGDRMVASGDMSTAQADSGFQRLPMPFSVSGLSNSHLQKAANRFNAKGPVVVGGSTSAAAEPTAIVPGGNLAGSLSYGDITYAGMGTATAVCGNEVLAFGHPLLWSGHSTLSMHGGDAIYIQKDTVFGSFKVANASAPVGQVNGDHLAGIHGILGMTPKSTEVTSYVEKVTNGDSRRGKTVVTYRPATPYLSSLHLLSNADRVLDKIGSGTATVRWTFDGTRADGSTWTFSRFDRFASRRDITFASIWDSYRQMSQIMHNKYERVRITDVHYRAQYSPRYNAFQIEQYEIKPADRWITITDHRPARTVYAGTDLPVRVTLTPSRDTAESKVVRLSVRIPKSARGHSATLYVSGGDDEGRTRAGSFDEFLDKLESAPTNDTVTATVRAEKDGRGSSRTSDSEAAGDVVSGDKHVHLRVR